MQKPNYSKMFLKKKYSSKNDTRDKREDLADQISQILGSSNGTISKKLKFKPPKSTQKSSNSGNTLAKQWQDRQTMSKDKFKLDLETAKLVDRGGSEDELETNKTVKMINQKIKDFEQEFQMMQKLRN